MLGHTGEAMDPMVSKGCVCHHFILAGLRVQVGSAAGLPLPGPFLLTPVWMAGGRDTQCTGVRQVLMRKTLEVSSITTHALSWVLLDAALGQSCKSQFTEMNVN